jgi:hypothetical protein
MHARPQQLIAQLQLSSHPEGGHYRELFRSSSQVQPADERAPRSALTTIYYLLAAGQYSRWHRVRSDEVWHFYEGEPLELWVASADFARIEQIVLGVTAAVPNRVATVPAGCWQAARLLGTYALLGCTVGPGFDFADFTLLRENPAALQSLERRRSALLDLA